jgi:tetratricopeptide (TPR) repeat protein
MRKDVLWPAATCMAVVLAITAAISLRRQNGEARGGGKREELREALRQEAASPYRWCDLGEALLEEGQKEKARYCFQQAEKLAPNLPPIWMRAAFFHFQMEETDAAIQCSARVLKTVPDYDQVIFNYFDRLAPNVEAVLPHLGDNRRAGQAYFRHLLGAEATGWAAIAWKWLRERRFADDGLAAGYLDLLLKQRMTEEAVQVWVSYLGSRRGDYPESNLLFNGDFESPPTGAALDWRITAVPGAVMAMEDQGARSGRWSLHISFQGSENLSYRHAAQTVCVRTGEYVFQAYARTKGLTTDEGIRFHLFDPESSARLDVYTEQLRGTNNWTRLEKRCGIRAGTRLILVQVCRMPSWKFDNKIKGEAWLDDVSLKAAH